MERFQILQLFARGGVLDGLAGHGPNRQRRAAAGIAVQLGQQHAVEPIRPLKASATLTAVLAGHGVHHQQDLLGPHPSRRRPARS
jgi:hypothetical protein